MNTQKINLGEALKHMERLLIPKADKNFKKNFDNRLYNCLFEGPIKKLPNHLLRDIIKIYLDMFVAIFKEEMYRENKYAKEDEREIIYKKETIERVTPKQLLKNKAFQNFIYSELYQIKEVERDVTYRVTIDMVPIEIKNGRFEFWYNLESRRALKHFLDNPLVFFYQSKNRNIDDHEKKKVLQKLHDLDSKITEANKYIDLSFGDIYGRSLTLIENLELMDFKENRTKAILNNPPSQTRIDPRRKDMYKFLNQLKRKNSKLTKSQRYFKFADEIIGKDLILWEEFKEEQKVKAKNDYLKFNKKTTKIIHPEKYWEGEIDEIPKDDYFNDLKNNVSNKFIGTSNREYAKKEYKKLFMDSSDKEFDLYFDAYYYYLDIGSLKELNNLPALKKEIYNKLLLIGDHEKANFKEAKNQGIFYSGCTSITKQSLGYKYYDRYLSNMRKQNWREENKKK